MFYTFSVYKWSFLFDTIQVKLEHYKRWPRLMHLQTQDFEEMGGGKYVKQNKFKNQITPTRFVMAIGFQTHPMTILLLKNSFC